MNQYKNRKNKLMLIKKKQMNIRYCDWLGKCFEFINNLNQTWVTPTTY